MKKPVFFDAIERVLCETFIESRESLHGLQQLIAIRDLFGRVRFLVEQRCAPESETGKGLTEFARKVADRLGPRAFPAEQAFLYVDELASDVTSDLQNYSRLLSEGPPEFRLLDRQISGQAWGIVRRQEAQNVVPRLAFYSLKGGVGRSTAAAVAAWHLAKQGRKVLVLDLDLEAPGLSTALLPEERQPEYGLVDWFVEDAVGQGDACLEQIVAASPLAQDLPGQIWVVPSHGAKPGDYFAKLGRCYLNLSPRDNVGPEHWEQRMVRVIAALEQRQSPDVMLLDLRAGLPDLSAVPATDLGAEILLFALNTDQTWAGYRLLLEHWHRTEAIRSLRERLHMVAALVAETDRGPYLEGFRQKSWDLLRDFAYDDIEPSTDTVQDTFSFDLAEDPAPHAPIPIYWNRGFASITNLHILDDTLVQASYGHFLECIDPLISLEEESSK